MTRTVWADPERMAKKKALAALKAIDATNQK